MNKAYRFCQVFLFVSIAIAIVLMTGCSKPLPPSIKTVTVPEPVTVQISVPQPVTVTVPVYKGCDIEMPEKAAYSRPNATEASLFDKAKAVLIYILGLEEERDKLRAILDACKQ